MLVVDVTDAGTDIVSLPIKARCVVPPVVCDPRWIDLGRCFLRYPYLNRVTLVNDSDLSTRYELMPQVAGDSLPFNFQSDRPKVCFLINNFAVLVKFARRLLVYSC